MQLRKEKAQVKKNNSFEIVILKGVVSAFYSNKSVDRGKNRFWTHSSKSTNSNIAVVGAKVEERPQVIWSLRYQIWPKNTLLF